MQVIHPRRINMQTDDIINELITILIARNLSLCDVLMTNEKHNSYNQFLFHSFLSVLHVSNKSTHSSSGARHNILYYTVWYNWYKRYNCAGYSPARLYRLYCVIQYIMPCCWWWTTRFVRNIYSRQKNCGIKIDYKNCASRWSLTQYFPRIPFILLLHKWILKCKL